MPITLTLSLFKMMGFILGLAETIEEQLADLSRLKI
jgi:hypothetical protein